MADTPDTEREWHLDKRVPIALIVTIALTFTGQGIAFTMWATKLDNRVAALETKDQDRDDEADKQAAAREKQSDKLNDIATAIATLNAKSDATNVQLSDVKAKVDNLTVQVLQQKKSE